MSGWCGLCHELVSWDELKQLLPCFHYFCIKCITKYQQLTKAKMCPEKNCFSLITIPDGLHYNACESDNCNRKMAYFGETKPCAECRHILCLECFAIANKGSRMCPIEECGKALNQEDIKEKCEACKLEKLHGEMTLTPCCQARFCKSCYEGLSKTGGKCAPNKCIKMPTGRGKKKQKKHSNCMGSAECDNETQSNFPSGNECEHDMCLSCLKNMITESESENGVPHCPNESCLVQYKMETVRALRIMFPDKNKYFEKFDLDIYQSLEALRDDTTMFVSVNKDFNPAMRSIDVKVALFENEEQAELMQFDKKGTLGEFVREARCALGIFPTDNVYNLMLREEGKEEEQISLTVQNVARQIDDFGLTPTSIVILDTHGYVNAKKAQKK